MVAKKKPSDNLSDLERKFVAEYLKDGHGGQAARRAGYSAHTASSIASRLLTRVKVREAVDRGLERSLESSLMTKERALKELEIIGLANHADFVRIEGEGKDQRVIYKPTDQLPLHQSRAIQNIKQTVVTTRRGDQTTTTTSIDLGLHSKAVALTAWLKGAGHIKDKVELSGDKENPVQVKFYLPGNGRS